MRNLFLRGVRFGGVGATCAFLSYFSFLVAIRLEVSLVLANCIGWFIGVLAGFVLNRRVTFGIYGRERWARQLAFFLLGSIAQLVVGSASLWWMVNSLSFSPALAAAINTVALAGAMFAYQSLVTFAR